MALQITEQQTETLDERVARLVRECVHPDVRDGEYVPTLREKRQMAGRLGGLATVERYGTEHMRQIGREGFAAMCDKHHNGDRADGLHWLAAQKKVRVGARPRSTY